MVHAVGEQPIAAQRRTAGGDSKRAPLPAPASSEAAEYLAAVHVETPGYGWAAASHSTIFLCPGWKGAAAAHFVRRRRRRPW